MPDCGGADPKYCVACGTRRGDFHKLSFCPHDGGLLMRSFRIGEPNSERKCETCGRFYVPLGSDFIERT